MTKGTFEKVGDSDKKMFGPRKIIICGFPAKGQSHFTKLLKKLGLDEIPVVYVKNELSEKKMRDIAELPQGTGEGEDSTLPLAIIMSGFTENELKNLMAGYREAGFPPPFWAVLTETSVDWPLKKLLDDLAAEREALT